METSSPTAPAFHPSTKSMLIGTGLAFASLILVPALAHRLGMNMPLIGATGERQTRRVGPATESEPRARGSFPMLKPQTRVSR